MEQQELTQEQLEWVMENYDGDPHSDIFYTPEQVKSIEIYTRLHKQNQHKMLPIPIFKLNL